MIIIHIHPIQVTITFVKPIKILFSAYEQAETWSNDGDTPAYHPDPEPEPEPEPVQMNGTGGGAVEVTLKALYSYTADDDDELSFEEGDEIVKLSEPDSEGKI